MPHAATATKRLTLPDVTLVAVTSVALPQTVRAMVRSIEQVRFGAAVLLSDRRPDALPGAIEWRRIDAITSREAYSRFMLRALRDHVATSHVLCVQWDGYVLDAAGWDARFLEVDYVGAPWPHFADGHDVGNGGFSLRSRRLLDACAALGVEGPAEDVAIGRTWRARLEREAGVRFAPLALARHFAFERHAATGGEFGFHGAFNMLPLVGADALTEMVATLEPAVLNRREHRELLRIALAARRWRLAHAVLRRMRRGTRAR